MLVQICRVLVAALRQPIFKSSTRAAISEGPSQHSSWTNYSPCHLCHPCHFSLHLFQPQVRPGIFWPCRLPGEIIAWVATRPSKMRDGKCGAMSQIPTPTPAQNKPVGLRSFLIDWAPPETATALGFLRVLLTAARCTSHELLSTTCEARDDTATVLWCSANRHNLPKY